MLTLLLTVTLCAQDQDPRAPTPGRRALQVASRPVELSITPVTDHTVRISLAPLDASGTPAVLRDEPVLVKRTWNPPVLRLRSMAPPQKVKAGRLSLSVNADPLSIRIQGAGGRVIQDLRINQETGSVSFSLGDGPIFGLGQGGPQFDRRGQIYNSTNNHGGYRLGTHGGRMPVPWLVSASGWALFFHQPPGAIDLTSVDGRFSADGSEMRALLDLFVVSGEPAQIMREYAVLTGFPSMPPLWALGYIQSHRTLRDFDEVMWVAKTFREKKLGCDVLIYLGTGWCPSGWNTGHDSYDFNPKVFSNPPQQIRQLRDLNFRVILHSTYPPRGLYGSVDDPSVTPADEQGAVHYWSRHQPASRLGVDGWWPDAAENLSVESRLARIRMYWEGPQKDHPNQRPFALHRTGYAGMQRLGGWLWSGDVQSTWETLRNHVPIAINTSLTGVPFWGMDIGGFYPTREYKGELHVRWFQLGAFFPLFRSHGRTWYTRLPWGWGAGILGPDEMEQSPEHKTAITLDDVRNPLVEPITRKYIELRYRMLPYIYSAAEEAHRTGMPMIRSLWLHYPGDPQAVARGDEFLWGRDLLVAPVVEAGATSRSLYLPRGSWYDFWNEEKVEGGRVVSRPVDLETTPLYVRAGAIVPSGPVKQYTSQKVAGALTLNVYSGADGGLELYEDDGTTFNFAKSESMRIRGRWNDRARSLTLALGDGSKMLPPGERQIEIRLVPGNVRRNIVFKGQSTTIRF
ncbi:MAG: TIM-barrel domain-containing protein [Bryobacteraceae bacterium]